MYSTLNLEIVTYGNFCFCLTVGNHSKSDIYINNEPKQAKHVIFFKLIVYFKPSLMHHKFDTQFHRYKILLLSISVDGL